MPGRHHRTFVATPIGTATPNTVYTQQAAKPACQEDITVHLSQLLLAQLPRTQFTHSKLPNPHSRKTSPQYVRISYWQGYPQHSLHTASCQIRMPGRHHRNMFASPIGRATPNTVYTQQAAKPAWHQRRPGAPQPVLEALNIERSRGPAATRRAATLSRALSTAPATQRGAAGQRRPGAPQLFLEALSTAPATGAAGQRRPGAPQPFREALSTAPATEAGAAGQRRPGVPQPFLEALNTAPATQRARRNPF